MKKKLGVFLLLFMVAIMGVTAAEMVVSVGADYGFQRTQEFNYSSSVNYIGGNVSLFSFADEFSSNGFLFQFSYQVLTSLTASISDGLTKTWSAAELKETSPGIEHWTLLTALVGYTHRFDVGENIDLALGIGPTFQLRSFEYPTLVESTQYLGFGASVEAHYLFSPMWFLSGGVGAYYRMYDLDAKKMLGTEDASLLIRPYVAVGFRF